MNTSVNRSNDQSATIASCSSDYQSDSLPQATNKQNEKVFPIIGMEPALLLIFFAISVSGTVFQNQIIYQTCTFHFGYNESDCAMLGKQNNSPSIEIIESVVEPYAAKIFMTQTMIKTIVPVLMSLFIGPWSDRFGRIPVTVCSIIGYFLNYSIVIVIAHLSSIMLISPWLYTLAFIPMSFLGGNCGLFVGIFCYVSDTSSMKNRALKMAVMEAFLYVGLVAGLISSSYILQMTSPIILYSISAIGTFIALVYVLYFVDESIQGPAHIKGFKKFRALFDFHLVSNMLQTCFKKRLNWDRTIIWIAILSIGATLFVLEGSLTVFYLFIREKFGWSIKEFTFYNAANIIIQVIGNVIGLLFFRKFLHTPESVVGFIGFICASLHSLIQGISVVSWHLWAATGVALLKGVATPMCRAILANTVPLNEIGAIYSLTASIENLTPLASAPLYSFVYAATIETNPGVFCFISATIFGCCAIIVLMIYVIQRRYPRTNYEILSSE